jgi:putative ABC transport system permease protein
MPMAFDLEKAIAAWRRPFEHNRAFSGEDTEELEGSLRDRVAALVETGLTEEAAFRTAVGRMGAYGTAEAEYRKVYWGKLQRQHQLKNELQWRLSMLKNYLKIALRNLGKQKGYTFINVAGLAVGLACFILISLFVRFELSYDRFHENSDRIFRIVKEDPGNYYLGTNLSAITPAPIVPALLNEFPEVEYAVQIQSSNILFRKASNYFSERGVYVTQHFFDVFSFALLEGDTHTALAAPGSVVLTTSMARKYFGTMDPMGQTLTYVQGGNEGTLTVTGVVADPPPNSHFTFTYLVSMTTSDGYRAMLGEDDWGSNGFYTYVSLHPGYDLSAFKANLVVFAQKYLPRFSYYQENPERISIYFPQALTDIHLHSHLNFESWPNGDIKYLYIFSAIGLLILLIACINYMNLATARSVMRAKEVGVRKVMGAHRVQLVGQFLGEATILSVIALSLALLLVWALLPAFNVLTARQISLAWTQQSGFWLVVVGLSLAVGLLAGSYPALMLSGYKPVGVLKGMLQHRRDKPTLRNVLVVTQFAVTTALIVGTITIYQQLHYIRTANTGVDRDHIVSIPIEDPAVRGQYEALKEALAQDPGILGITAARLNPTAIGAQKGATSWEGAEEGEHISVYHTDVQYGFVEMFGIELVEGRDFSETVTADAREGLLINETMARQLGWETAVGKWFNFNGREYRVIGVIKDFNFLSFRQAMAPLALYLGERGTASRLLVKVRPEQIQTTLALLQQTMVKFSPAYPFNYEFLDDAHNNMYKTDVRLGGLVSYFTGLALFIACLGLFGLVAFTATQRTKEIGVRKVLGASLADILGLLSKDFLKLVGLAFVLAAPLAYFVMQRWLEDFAYHIEVGPGLFLLAGGLTLLIALLTIGYQAVKAALADPVKSLRYE